MMGKKWDREEKKNLRKVGGEIKFLKVIKIKKLNHRT